MSGTLGLYTKTVDFPFPRTVVFAKRPVSDLPEVGGFVKRLDIPEYVAGVDVTLDTTFISEAEAEAILQRISCFPAANANGLLPDLMKRLKSSSDGGQMQYSVHQVLGAVSDQFKAVVGWKVWTDDDWLDSYTAIRHCWVDVDGAWIDWAPVSAPLPDYALLQI